VSAGSVNARAVETDVWVEALVDVGAVTSSLVDLVAGVTVAAEHADQVPTATVDTQVTKHATFVDI